MRKIALLFLSMFFCIIAVAQEKLYISKSDKVTLGALIENIDSIYFSTNGSIAYMSVSGMLAEFPVSGIDSIYFGENSNTVSINYAGESVTVINPLAFEGVSVEVDNGDVIIQSQSEMQDINYCLSGETQNGMFKIYSDKRYNILLNGVSITNPDGPALNIQSKKKTSIELVTGTENVLTDGLEYAAAAVNSNGEEEDQKAAFFSEAKLVFNGEGSLTINGLGSEQHGLCSDDLIIINSGTININSSVKDGIHGKDGIEISGGTIHVNSSGDAIDGDNGYLLISGGSVTTINDQADVKGLSCDSTLTIIGGILDLTVSGNQSKAIKSDQGLTLSGGNITIHNSGDAVLEATGSGFDPSYCTAIKSDSDILINGSEITIISSGKGSKSISSDANIEILSGTVHITNSGTGVKYNNSLGQADAYVATCLTADSNIRILGGTVTTISSGIAGKGISADVSLFVGTSIDSPIVNITTSGAKLLVSGSGNNANYAEAKAISCDSDVSIENGTITISSADDGIKSQTAITISNASLTINNSVEGLEAPFITINSGEVYVKSSDDALNATFGNGGEFDDGSMLKINGGQVVLNATNGDGLDSNGDVMINGGLVIVHGPQSNPEVGLDYNGDCSFNGGMVIIAGPNSFMTQGPGGTSSQRSILAKTNTNINSTTLFQIQDANGTDILTFQGIRNYGAIVFSSSSLVSGATYSIYTGGSYTGGTINNGYFSGGTYSGGTLKKTFSISGTVTNVNF